MSKSDPTVAAPPPPGADHPAQAEPFLPTSAASLASAASPEPANVLASLTDKQRAVLDLLIEHKTSKEISRLLGISHHTVDQRIMLARAKLGVVTRGEVAQAYRRLVADAASAATSSAAIAAAPAATFDASLYERSVYDFSDVATPLDALQERVREDRTDWVRPQQTRTDALPRAAYQGGDALAEPYHRVLPEMFDGPYGTILRLGTIAVFAMFLILIVLGGLAMFAQLSQMIPN